MKLFSVTKKQIGAVNTEEWINKHFIWVIIFLTSLLYANSVFNDYNLDDELVTINHRLTSKGLSAIPEIFTSPYYQDNMGYSYEYRPMVLATFAIEHQFFGDNPHVSHFINLLIYILSSIMVFVVVSNLFPDTGRVFAMITTVLFVLHPIHTEAVANIKNRDEILSLFGGLFATYSAICYAKSNKYIWLCISFLSLLAGILSKQSVISFIFILPMVILIVSSNKWRNYITISLCVLIVAVIVFYLRNFTVFVSIKFISLMVSYFIILFVLFNTEIFIQKINRLKQILGPPFQMVFSYLKKINVPEISSIEYSLFNKHRLYSLAIFILMIAGVILNNPYLKFSSLLLTLLHPLLLFEYRMDMLLLTIIAFGFLGQSFDYMVNNILALYHVWLFRNATNKNIHKLLLLHISLAASTFLNQYIDNLDVIGAGLLPTTAGFIGSQMALFVIYLTGYALLLNRGVFATKIILISVALPSLFGMIKLDIKNIFFIFELILFPSVLFFNGVGKWQKTITFSIIILATIYFGIEYFNDYLIKAIPEITSTNSTVNTSFNNDTVVYNNAINPISNTQDDRPLEFVEYPLGFDASKSQKYGTSLLILARYLKMMFVPWPMNFYYGYNEVKIADILDPLSILSFIIHIVIMISALIHFKKSPVYFFGSFIYLASILLYSNLLSPIAGMIGDRLTFTASFGFCIIFTFFLFKIFKIKPFKTKLFRLKPAFILIVICITVTYSYLTIARNAQWKNHITLMRHDIRHVTNSAQAHSLLATNLMKYSFDKDYSSTALSMRKEAIDHYKKSLEIYPEFFNAWYNLGRAYLTLNDIDNAYPCFIKVHQMDSALSEATLNIALIANNKGDINTAIKYLEKLIRINPYVKEAYSNLSYIYFKQGLFEHSINVNKKAINYNPAWKDPYINIAQVYLNVGDTILAQQFFKEAEMKGTQ